MPNPVDKNWGVRSHSEYGIKTAGNHPLKFTVDQVISQADEPTGLSLKVTKFPYRPISNGISTYCEYNFEQVKHVKY